MNTDKTSYSVLMPYKISFNITRFSDDWKIKHMPLFCSFTHDFVISTFFFFHRVLWVLSNSQLMDVCQHACMNTIYSIYI